MVIRLLQLSDTHFAAGGAEVNGRDPAVRLAAVLDAVRVDVDALVLTGDLADDGSRAGCERLAARLAPLGRPVLAVPGNHDDPRAVRDVFGPDVLEVGGWRLVGVDTSRPGRIPGAVEVAAEMARLDAYDDRPTLLAMHHPPVSPSTHPWFELAGAAELTAAVARRPHVRALLTGHLHHPFEAEAGGVAVLGAPSVLIAFRHDGDEVVMGGADTTGARVVSLHDDGTLTSSLIRA